MPEWSEVLVILVVAMVVFGPHRLPAMARKAGKMVAEFRVAARELRQGLERELAVEEMREAAQDVMTTTRDACKELRGSLSESEKALRPPPQLAQPSDTRPGAQRAGPGDSDSGADDAVPGGAEAPAGDDNGPREAGETDQTPDSDSPSPEERTAPPHAEP